MQQQYITSNGIQQMNKFEKCLLGDDFTTAVPGWMFTTQQITFMLRAIRQTQSSIFCLRVTFIDGSFDDFWAYTEKSITDYIQEQYGITVTIE